MKKVYVAGASKNMARARVFIDRVEAHASLSVTHDWVADIEAAGTANEGLSDSERARYARQDLYAVATADVVVLLAENEKLLSRGMWVEMGYAIAKDIPILVAGGRKRSIFTAPGIVLAEYVDDDACFRGLVKLKTHDEHDPRTPCGMCGAPKQSPATGVRCGMCGVRRGDDEPNPTLVLYSKTIKPSVVVMSHAEAIELGVSEADAAYVSGLLPQTGAVRIVWEQVSS